MLKSNSFDAATVKKDFPILSRTMNGKPLVYLDSAATTQKPAAVIDALAEFYRSSNANIHRGVYPLAEEATARYEKVREDVARFLGSPTSNNIVFTRNATESINLVAHAWARKHLKKGDEILISLAEHHANIVPWYLLAKERGVVLKQIPLDKDFSIDLDAYVSLLTPKVRLVAVTAMSNVVGTIMPVREIVRQAHAKGALVLVDGAQSAPHLPTNLKEIDCDFYALSAHKMLGPTGVGVLWIKPSLVDSLDPFMGGGEMINSVQMDEITWAEPPLKFEAGTPDYPNVAAFSEAIAYLDRLSMEAVRAHEKEILGYALRRLEGVPSVKIYGPKDPEKMGGAIAFNHTVVHAHDVGTILGEEGVAIRVGHHCAQPLMRHMGVPATARVSFYVYNTREDVDAFVNALAKVDRVFGLTGAPRP